MTDISPGDQYENCHYFEGKGVTRWIEQDALVGTDLGNAFGDLLAYAQEFNARRASLTGNRNAVEIIANRLTIQLAA